MNDFDLGRYAYANAVTINGGAYIIERGGDVWEYGLLITGVTGTFQSMGRARSCQAALQLAVDALAG